MRGRSAREETQKASLYLAHDVSMYALSLFLLILRDDAFLASSLALFISFSVSTASPSPLFFLPLSLSLSSSREYIREWCT